MTGSTNKATATTSAILIVGAVLLGATALIGNSEEISYPDTFNFQPADYEVGTAVVVSKGVDEGLRLLGFEFRKPEYHIDVAFTVLGQECFFALADREVWPVADARCTSSQHVSGALSGLGTTAEGDTYVSVTIEVGGDCYAGTELGMVWPGSSESCA